MSSRLVLCLFAILILAGMAVAEVPKLINYQGILMDSDGHPVTDDIYHIRFRIYDAAENGNVLWESVGDAGYVPVTIAEGLYNHLLGSSDPLPDSLVDYDSLWLGVKVGLADQEMVPRTKLVSVAFALKSMTSDYADTSGNSRDKTTNASELVSGDLDTARYSAYEDLVSEDRIGEQPGQVAAGNHTHLQGAVGLIQDTTWQLYTISEMTTLKTLVIPPETVGNYLRILCAVENWNGEGTVSVHVNGGDVWHQYFSSSSTRIIDQVLVRHRSSTWFNNGYSFGINTSYPITVEIIGSPLNGSSEGSVGSLIVEYGIP